jgi:hypothetical protein
VQHELTFAEKIPSEVSSSQNTQTHEDSAIKLGVEALLHAAVQQPLDGATQLVNHVAARDILPDPQLFAAPKQASFGSLAWYCETAGSGLGMILPYLIVKGTSTSVLAKAKGLAEGTTLMPTLKMSTEEAATAGKLASAVRFSAPAAKMALDGGLYGLVLTPSDEPSKTFWGQRGRAAASSAITFGAMGLTSLGIMEGAAKLGLPLADSAFNLSAKGIAFRVGANALGGSVGGFASAESNSLLSGKGLASKEEVTQSIASFMVAGATLETIHATGDFYHAAADVARTRALYAPPRLDVADQQMLEQLQKAHFQYFKEESDPVTGLTKDRSTDTSPASIAAVGFSLTAHGVAVDHGWVSRDEAANYTLKVLNNLWSTKQGDEALGTSGNHGLFYHFLDPQTGLRMGQNEVSTIDTALLMSGVLYSKNYFDGTSPKETQIRELSDKLYNRVDWNWTNTESGRLSMGWTPESGFIEHQWQAYDEAHILLLLAMGSPTHPVPASAWETYMSTAKIASPYEHESLQFGPLFGHQYTQVWLDFRGRMDATNKKLGMDYFQNSRQAALAQHQYAIANPQGWKDYGHLDWGLTASDGPGEVTKTVDGRERVFHGYNARGFPDAPDDGTIAPTAAASSLPFAPEIVMPTLRHWLTTRPEIFGRLGFQDAFNPTFDTSKPSGWVDSATLGIDQGPILLMAENYRHGSIWQTMKNDANLKAALDKAGFSRRPATAGGVTWFSHVIGRLTGLE